MMGTKERHFRSLPEDISLEDLVPEDNFYRRLKERLDLSFVRELVEDLYAHSGRPSVDSEAAVHVGGIRLPRKLHLSLIGGSFPALEYSAIRGPLPVRGSRTKDYAPCVEVQRGREIFDERYTE